MSSDRTLVRFLAGVLLVFWLNVTASAQTPAAERLVDIDHFVEAELRAAGVPGATLAVAYQGQVFHARGYGSLAGHPDARLLIGSCTKPITALAVLQLAELGRINLQAPVSHYLPTLAAPPEGQVVRVADLLEHRSGLSTSAGQREVTSRDRSADALSRAIARLETRDYAATPGKRFAYSNANYMLLGAILETVTGQPFDRSMSDLVFAPLGLGATSATTEQTGGPTYRLVFGLPLLLAYPPAPRAYAAAGYMTSNASDLARFAGMFTGSDATPQTVFSTWVLNSMVTPSGHLPDEQHGALAYARGWWAGTVRGTKVIHHGGNLASTHCDLVALPDYGLSLAFLTNANVRTGRSAELIHGIAPGIVQRLTGKSLLQAPRMAGLLFPFAILCSLAGGFLAGLFQTIFRSTLTPRRRAAVAVRTAAAAVIAILLALGVPMAAGAPWQGVLLFQPDLGYLALGVVILGALLAGRGAAELLKPYPD